MAKNYNEISNNCIDDTKLLRLNLHILVLGCLKKGDIYFTKVKTNNNKVDEKNEDDQVTAIVSDLEEEKNK